MSSRRKQEQGPGLGELLGMPGRVLDVLVGGGRSVREPRGKGTRETLHQERGAGTVRDRTPGRLTPDAFILAAGERALGLRTLRASGGSHPLEFAARPTRRIGRGGR